MQMNPGSTPPLPLILAFLGFSNPSRHQVAEPDETIAQQESTTTVIRLTAVKEETEVNEVNFTPPPPPPPPPPPLYDGEAAGSASPASATDKRDMDRRNGGAGKEKD